MMITKNVKIYCKLCFFDDDDEYDYKILKMAKLVIHIHGPERFSNIFQIL